MGTQVTVILGNPSVSPFTYRALLVKQSKLHKPIRISRLGPFTSNGFLWWWPPSSFFPIIGMEVLTQHRATWNKPKFLAFLVGLSKWTPGTLPPLVKMVNIPQQRLKQATEGLRPVNKDMLETGVMKPPSPRSVAPSGQYLSQPATKGTSPLTIKTSVAQVPQ